MFDSTAHMLVRFGHFQQTHRTINLSAGRDGSVYVYGLLRIELPPVTLRFGVGAHQAGRWGANIAEQARRAEAAGFDSLWLGDHIISPRQIGSRYPYASSGEVPWVPEYEMFDAVVSATVAATVTSRLMIGFGTLVLPLRQPIVLAKQLATLDRLSQGRVILGAGVGWSREEFDALGANFTERFAVTAEWIELLRRCWTGYPGIVHGRHYDLAVDTACFPVPAGRLPILIGGHSSAARALAAGTADGWYPLLSSEQLAPEWLAPRWQQMREAAAEHGRDPAELVLTVYAAAELDEVCARLPVLQELGVQELVIGVDWDDPNSALDAIARLRAASSAESEFSKTEQPG